MAAGRRRRRTMVRGWEATLDDRDDESDELLDVSLDLAHRDMASSTAAAMAVNRPPMRDEAEDEDEEKVIETGLVDL